MANQGWEGFKGKKWRDDVDVRDFVQENYTPYDGDEAFLAGPTEATDKLWGELQKLQKEERARGGVLECDRSRIWHQGLWPRIHQGRFKGLGKGCWSSDRQAIEESIYAIWWY